MQLHLRKYVDSSIEEVLDFFKDFPTLEELSKALEGVPLRKFRYLVRPMPYPTQNDALSDLVES